MSKEPKRDRHYYIADAKYFGYTKRKHHYIKTYWKKVRTWWKQFIQQQRRFDNEV